MGITININKAKEIWKDKIRVARKPKLEELDIQFMKAQETGADTSAIVEKKQVLRDYTDHAGITTAQNAQDLKADWDTSILGDKPKHY